MTQSISSVKDLRDYPVEELETLMKQINNTMSASIQNGTAKTQDILKAQGFIGMVLDVIFEKKGIVIPD